MQLRVQHESGEVETVELITPVAAREGEFLNTLTDAAGIDHFFTPEGYYDGHGSDATGFTDDDKNLLFGKSVQPLTDRPAKRQE